MPQPPIRKRVLRTQTKWQDLWFYQKATVLYQLTVVFTQRFLPALGDRTVDQMVQAARSGKQNIVEGSADGVTSMKMELKLLNVARASIQELQEDYADYLAVHQLMRWTPDHPRYNNMLQFCRGHNRISDYEPYFQKWEDEEMANIGFTLCRMVDRMMCTYQEKKEQQFITEGGISERMTAARLDYRASQKQTIERLSAENNQLKQTINTLQQENQTLKQKLQAP